MEGYQLTYHVDMVFCIDATGSMRHVIDFVKQNALNLYRDITEEMQKKHKVVDRMRVRVMAFRDYVADGEDAMLSSDFFELPQQAQLFYDCVNGIEARGGGDIPFLSHWAVGPSPKETAMALSTWPIMGSGSLPICSRSLDLSMVRICSSKMTLLRLSPQLDASSSMWVGRRALPVWEVMAAAITVGL